jgi:hypothetical protein
MTTDAESIDPDEHIDPDDPRYDGFRIREIWAATAIAPDNQEAMLWVDHHDAVKHHVAVGPAFAADRRRLNHLRAYAQEQATLHEIEVRIRHFGPLADDGEVISP